MGMREQRSVSKFTGPLFQATRPPANILAGIPQPCVYTSPSKAAGELCPTELLRLPQRRISLRTHDLPGEERLTRLSEEKGLEHLFQWAFIEFSLHRDASQRKEVWFTESISGIRGSFLSQGQVDTVMPIGCKTLGNKLILCLVP